MRLASPARQSGSPRALSGIMVELGGTAAFVSDPALRRPWSRLHCSPFRSKPAPVNLTRGLAGPLQSGERRGEPDPPNCHVAEAAAGAERWGVAVDRVARCECGPEPMKLRVVLRALLEGRVRGALCWRVEVVEASRTGRRSAERRSTAVSCCGFPKRRAGRLLRSRSERSRAAAASACRARSLALAVRVSMARARCWDRLAVGSSGQLRGSCGPLWSPSHCRVPSR